jgi:hypothetical protein
MGMAAVIYKKCTRQLRVGGDQSRVSRAWPVRLRSTAVGVNFADTFIAAAAFMVVGLAEWVNSSKPCI